MPPTTARPSIEPAGEALKRQIQYLSLGQFGRAYAEIHPSQRSLFTQDQYERCGPGAHSIEVGNVEIVEEYEESTTIPGTTESVDSVAVTATVTMNGMTSTDTYHEIEVDGRWAFTVTDPQELIDC